MSEKPKKAAMPQGRRKGGTIFPRIDLEQAIKYAEKLVSKTHTGAQPPATLFPGVFGATGSRASVRSSALKQYGLMEGSDKAGYKATRLAIGISTAPPEERSALLREACLKPKVFGVLFDTYHGDEVSIAKIRQQAATTKVHPDELENCVAIFVESAVFADLGRKAGDQVQLVSSRDLKLAANGRESPNEDDEADGNVRPDDEEVAPQTHGKSDGIGGPGVRPSDSADGARTDTLRSQESGATNDGTPSARAVIHVNVTLDSSLDTEKLEKQLVLLRRFGAL